MAQRAQNLARFGQNLGIWTNPLFFELWLHIYTKESFLLLKNKNRLRFSKFGPPGPKFDQFWPKFCPIWQKLGSLSNIISDYISIIEADYLSSMRDFSKKILHIEKLTILVCCERFNLKSQERIFQSVQSYWYGTCWKLPCVKNTHTQS